MTVKQISVFVENEKGRLSRMANILAEAQVDIIALSVADTTNFGILRAIVDDSDKAVKALTDAGYTATITQVLACAVEDKPGGMAKLLKTLVLADSSVEYLYSYVRNPGKDAYIIFRVADTQHAQEALTAAGYRLLSDEDVQRQP